MNCRGYNAFGRRKRSIVKENTDLAVSGDLMSGQLREEITISSNAILTFERREERLVDPAAGKDLIKRIFNYFSIIFRLYRSHDKTE